MMSVVSGGIGISVVSMVGIPVVGISMTIAVVGKTIAISSIVSISGGGSVSGPLAVVSVVGIGMSIAGISVSMVGIAVVSEAISIGTVVSISISISGGGGLGISGPLAVVSMVTIGMGIAGIGVVAISISMVGKTIAVPVVGKAIAVGAIVGIGISLGLGGCVHSGEKAKSGNGSGLHVYLFVCKLEEIAVLPM